MARVGYIHTTYERDPFSVARALSENYLDSIRPFRAPHHSVSTLGALSELAVSAGGVFVLSEAREFRPSVVTSLLRVWSRMHRDSRPILVVDLHGAPASDTLERALLETLVMFGEQANANDG